jgi:osmotically-inducible protein OsmY
MGWLVLPAANRTLRRRRPAQHSRPTELAALGLGSAAGYAASRLTRRRRHVARDRAAATARHAAHDTARRTRFAAGFVKGAAHAVTSPLRPARSYDDVTLARKVETELFRPADAPKGSVDINCVNGIVEMRGRVDDPGKSEELAAAAERIEGVKGVRNLLRVGQAA